MKFARLSSMLLLLCLDITTAAHRDASPFRTRLFGVRKQHLAAVLPLRGGYSSDGAPREEANGNEDYLPPRISAEAMSLALRWTGEINRRLGAGTRPRGDDAASAASLLVVPPPQEAAATVVGGAPMVRGGGEVMESSPLSLSESAPNAIESHEQLTLFHAKSPRPTGFGANRWGPNLESYIRHICRQLNLPENSAAELSLALIYLDRASSPETPRSNVVQACPFLQPRTAHRLVLSALLLATQSTHGWPLPVLMERVQSLGIPSDQLGQMLQWMQSALGDPGYFVTQYQIQTWRSLLQATSKLRPHSQQMQQPQEQRETLKDPVPSATEAKSRETREEPVSPPACLDEEFAEGTFLAGAETA